MGRLMDAVLAVSVLAMASAVAWADWVMSCCGVSSVAMSQIRDDRIMVRKTWGVTKTSISQKPPVRLLPNSHSTFLGVSAML